MKKIAMKGTMDPQKSEDLGGGYVLDQYNLHQFTRGVWMESDFETWPSDF